VRTSNPGAIDLQDLDCGGAPLWRRAAEMLAPEAARLKGASGWSGLMAVAGATFPEQARDLRETLADSLFLVPGFGAQGGGAAAAVAGFKPGPHGLEGGVVSSSRALSYAPGAFEARNLEAWREVVSEAMAGAAAQLKAACSVGRVG
jgi:orotidine-5'-phosphate decarboxylase